jgi:outer membrane protein assembly factor BamB
VRPVWERGWLVLATTGGTILAFRAVDGLPIWRRDLASPAHAAPALAADRLYVPANNGRVVALRIVDGTPVWERRLGGPPNDMLALDDQLFVGAEDNYLYCIDAEDGQVRWRWRTGGDVIGRPVVDARSVYFVSFDNTLRALDRGSGVQQWIRPLPLRPTTGPLLAGSTVVITGLSPTLRGYNAEDGKPAGDLPIQGEMAAPPHLIAGEGEALPRLVVLTRDIAKGASVLLVMRSVEPGLAAFATLPNPILRVTNPGGPEPTASGDTPAPPQSR